MLRALYVFIGHSSLAVGFVGIFVPLLSAVCYSQGSKRFHTWLHGHPRFGVMIRSWREHGAIGARDKMVATVMAVLSVSYSFYRLDPPWSVASLTNGAAVLTLTLSRPSTLAEASLSRVGDSGRSVLESMTAVARPESVTAARRLTCAGCGIRLGPRQHR